MCGIAGWQFNKQFNPSQAFRSILLLHLAGAMDRRGGDSYGVARLGPRGGVRTWKGLGTAIGHLNIPLAADSQQLLLHTRKRTHGDISIFNAHPLQQGHILGTHNGVVSNHESLNKKYSRDFELDSRHIFEHLKDGLNLGEIGVYGAISWLDLNSPQVINLCRLSISGDLEIFGIGTSPEDVLGIVYASTKEPIIAALQSLRIKHFPYARVEEKRKYMISDGRLLVTKGDEGVLPFGDKPYYHTTYTTGGKYSSFHRGGQDERDWEIPAGFKMCKPCRKQYKKSKEFKAATMCSRCFDSYLEFLRPFRMCKDCGLDGAYYNHVHEVMLCDGCATLRRVGVDKKKGPDPHNPPPLALVKPGGESLDSLGRQEEQELLEAYARNRKPLVIPPYLEQWDLCNWCSGDIVKNKKWATTDFCVGCKTQWASMISELREMEKEERAFFSQVVQCSSCRVVPTFGWLKREAFLDDGKPIAQCKRCKEAKGCCSVCGYKDTVVKYAEPKGDRKVPYVPYCRGCYDKRGEVVVLGKGDSEDGEDSNKEGKARGAGSQDS